MNHGSCSADIFSSRQQRSKPKEDFTQNSSQCLFKWQNVIQSGPPKFDLGHQELSPTGLDGTPTFELYDIPGFTSGITPTELLGVGMAAFTL